MSHIEEEKKELLATLTNPKIHSIYKSLAADKLTEIAMGEAAYDREQERIKTEIGETAYNEQTQRMRAATRQKLGLPPLQQTAPTIEPGKLPEPIPEADAPIKRIAEELAATGLFVTGPDGLTRRYKDGIWQPIERYGPEYTYVNRVLDHKSTPKKVNDTLELLKIETFSHQGLNIDAPRGWLPLKDCDLNTVTFETRPTRKEAFWTYKIDASYDPEASQTEWLKFLLSCFRGDESKHPKIELLKQFAGLCLTTDVSFQKALLLTGTGANGKGEFLFQIVKLLAPASVSLSLTDLSQSNKAVQLAGKTLCYDQDLPRSGFDDGTFKKVVAGETIPAKLLYKDAFDITPVAKLLYASNSLPVTKDVSPAYFRRWLIVDFPNKFKVGGDPNLRERLTAERNGILLWALEGLKSVREFGLIEPDCSRQAVNEYRGEASSVNSFVTDEIETDPVSSLEASKAYDAYLEYCRREGFNSPIGKRKFTSELIENTGAIKRVEGRRRQVVLHGIRLINAMPY